MIMDDILTDTDRLIKKMNSYMEDMSELLKTMVECPNCSKRYKEYLQSKEQQQN